MSVQYYTGSTDARLTQALASEWRLALADRESIYGSPLAMAVPLLANAASQGSTTLQIPIISLQGVDRLAAVAENASTTPTDVTKTSVTVTIARQAMERSISDLNNMVDSVGFDLQALIDDGLGAFTMRWMEMLCNLFSSVSTTVGTTTVDMTADDWFSAKFTLTQASVPGPYVSVLFPTQLTDLQNSIRAEGGPWQYLPETQGILARAGVGMVAVLDGTPIFSSSLVPTANAGADSAGCMFGMGAFGYAEGTPRALRGAADAVFAAGTPLYSEIERDASGALSKVVHNAFLGFVEIEDSRAVGIVTDR